MQLWLDLSWIKRHYAPLILLVIITLSFWLRVHNFRYEWLMNIDSYFHMRYMRYIYEGETEHLTLLHDGELVDAIDLIYDPLSLAPNGRLFRPNLYHYLGAYSYALTKTFFPDLELWKFLVYFPAALFSLAAIPAYFIGKVLYDKRAGLLLAFLFLFNPAILARTMGGDPDNDCWVLLLPLALFATFLYGMEEENRRRALIYCALAGAWFAALAHSWVYWYAFYLMTGFVLLKFLLEVSMDSLAGKKIKVVISERKELLIRYCVVIIVFLALTVPWLGFVEVLDHLLFGPFGAFALKAEVGDFPNVYVSVAELMEGGSVRTVAERVGIPLFFFALVLFLPYSLASFLFKRKHLDTLLFVSLWMLGWLYASMVAIRFTIFLVFPLALATSIVLVKLLRFAKGEDRDLFG